MAVNLQEQGKESALSVVNDLVANLGVLYVKLHQYHWYVQGPEFFRLHEKFEELYNEATALSDTFAERLIAKGEKPYSTLKEYLDNASISEKPYTQKISAEDMVRNLIKDYETIGNLVLRGIELAGEENDSVTEDILIGYKESIDKTLWMLQAFLGKDVK